MGGIAGSGHVALLGDSIFDNRSYTRGDPDVVTHLRAILPERWQATLCAVDGATTRSLGSQLPCVPRDATHLVVAIGGNDALQNIDLLNLRVSSTAQALSMFADRVEGFERDYRAALDGVLSRARPVTVCTIYNGNLEDGTARHARTALTLFNDVILRTAVERRLNVVELRAICCEAADYANPIEPSGQGGRKIAAAVARAIGAIDSGVSSRIWSGGPDA